MLEVLVRIGPDAVPGLIEKLSRPDVDSRFYATYAFSVFDPIPALSPLIARLFDDDPSVAFCAADVLFRIREAPEFERVSAGLRNACLEDGEPPETRRRALVAVREFRLVEAIEPLIRCIEDSNADVAQEALQALVAITKQDFGDSKRKWLKWQKKNGATSRVAWLIQGLASKDDNIRLDSLAELRHITGLDHGYVHNASERARKAAIKEWLSWWDKEGAKAFPSGGGRVYAGRG